MSGIKAQEFLVPNPLLYSDLKKYLWINDTQAEHNDAQRLFDYMLKEGIYIDGFTTETKSLIDLKMFHKKVFDINTLDSKVSVVFYETYFGSADVSMEQKGLNRARVINPDIQSSVVIWGAGETGEYAFRILQENKIRIRYFVDSNKKLRGTTKCGLPVYVPDRLYEDEDVIVIEALENWKKLDVGINDKVEKRFHYSLHKQGWNQFTWNDNGVERNLFNLGQWWCFSFFENKKIYIYGYGIAECEFARYLKLLDYDFAGFLIDENDNSEVDDNWNLLRCVEDILYESNYYIWIYDQGKTKRLKELGFNYFENYASNNCPEDITIEKKLVLDVNLGHNYTVGGKYPGIVVHGEDKKGDYKIAVLGGSTTDGLMYPFKSWTEFLYEKLGKDNITIYNCGTGGYTSGQELLKLIRDVLPLKPDMIIVYDGFNEINVCDVYPFAFNYMQIVFNFANSHMEISPEFSGDATVCFGVESQKNMIENWMSNIRFMHAVAQQNGIKFYSFCQPMLSSKKGKSEKEKNILLSWSNMYLERAIKQSFRSYLSKASDLPGYIYDLSHIFDGQDDIYMDMCHVWEKGNEIIAEEIKKIILQEVEKEQN